MARHQSHDRLPQRPGDLAPDASPAVLVDAYQRHLLVLAGGRGDARPAGETAARALAALAIGQALAADLAEERWPIVRDALVAGATRAQVSSATGGLEADELAAGLTAWADRQVRVGRMAEPDHVAVCALVGTWPAEVLRGVG